PLLPPLPASRRSLPAESPCDDHGSSPPGVSHLSNRGSFPWSLSSRAAPQAPAPPPVGSSLSAPPSAAHRSRRTDRNLLQSRRHSARRVPKTWHGGQHQRP